MNRPLFSSLLWICLGLLLSQCSSSGGGGSSYQESLVEADIGYESWPNSSTSEPTVSYISSKILVTDLNKDGQLENVFISALPHSSNPKSSILRITKTAQFTEISNFKSTQIHLLKDSSPYAIDLNDDGQKELLFINYDRDEVVAMEFKNKKMDTIQVRWRLRLPKPLPEDFNREFSEINLKGQKYIKIGNYGFYERGRSRKLHLIALKQIVDNLMSDLENIDHEIK